MDGFSCDGDKRVNYPTFVPNCLNKRTIFVRFFVDNGGGELFEMAICELFEMYSVCGCWGYGWGGCWWGA